MWAPEDKPNRVEPRVYSHIMLDTRDFTLHTRHAHLRRRRRCAVMADGARHASKVVDELGLTPFVRENSQNQAVSVRMRLEVELQRERDSSRSQRNEKTRLTRAVSDMPGEISLAMQAEEEADEGGLKEEGHRAEDVAPT